MEDSGWVEICRILAGSAPKLEHFGAAVAERASKLFSQGLQKKPAECLPVSGNATLCSLLLAGAAGRQVANGDGLICAKPD